MYYSNDSFKILFVHQLFFLVSWCNQGNIDISKAVAYVFFTFFTLVVVEIRSEMKIFFRLDKKSYQNGTVRQFLSGNMHGVWNVSWFLNLMTYAASSIFFYIFPLMCSRQVAENANFYFIFKHPYKESHKLKRKLSTISRAHNLNQMTNQLTKQHPCIIKAVKQHFTLQRRIQREEMTKRFKNLNVFF